MHLLMNKQGFTLINHLLRLVILFIFLPLLTLIISRAEMIHKNNIEDVYQFYIFVQNEINLASELNKVGNDLYITDINDHVIKISQYKDVIRRQVNQEGHEILLRNVQDMKIKAKERGFSLEIHLMNGESYERIIVF